MPGRSLSFCICLYCRLSSKAEDDVPPGEPKRGTGDEVAMVVVVGGVWRGFAVVAGLCSGGVAM